MTPFGSWKRRKTETKMRERRLAAAETEVAHLRTRAEKVTGPLERRLRRNYWSETAAAIARREPS